MANREWRTFDGHVRQGVNSFPCKVTTLESHLNSNEGSVAAGYSQITISEVSPDAPQGQYDLTFAGRSGRAVKRNGEWTAPSSM